MNGDATRRGKPGSGYNGQQDDFNMEGAKIALLKKARLPTQFQDVPLKLALESIKNGVYENLLLPVKKAYANYLMAEEEYIAAKEKEPDKEHKQPDKEPYRAAKSTLPCLGFNGTFKSVVNNANFTESSGLFHFDIDGLAPETIETDKAKIAAIPSCVFCFISPSGAGLKGALRVARGLITCDADFKAVFPVVETFFIGLGFELDASCKDVRRLCFVSYDPNIYVNYDAAVLVVPGATHPKIEPRKTTKTARLKKDDASSCIAKVEAILLNSSPGNRHEARLRAGRLAGGFISSNRVSEIQIKDILLQVSDSIANGGATPKSEIKTLMDAIAEGKKSPVYDDPIKKNPSGFTYQAPEIDLDDPNQPPLWPDSAPHNADGLNMSNGRASARLSAVEEKDCNIAPP
ncbi:MAG: BT4734/BF3469 family protein, partial [Methylococcaceae bacterium]